MKGKEYDIWDAHVHIFPGRLLKAIWRWFDKFGMEMPYKGLSKEQLTQFLLQMGVRSAFLLVYAHKADVSAGINRWVYDFSLEHPMFFPFGCVHPHDRNLDEIIEMALDEYNFYGIKIQYLVLGMRPDAPEFTPVYKALEKRGKMLVAHASTAPLPRPWLGMDIFERVLAAHPGLRVQIAHLGHYELKKVASLMLKYPNLYLDTAWAMGNEKMDVNLDEVRDLILKFPGRIMYGSDFPIILEDPRYAVEKIKNFSLGEEFTRSVLSGNASELVKKIQSGIK